MPHQLVVQILSVASETSVGSKTLLATTHGVRLPRSLGFRGFKRDTLRAFTSKICVGSTLSRPQVPSQRCRITYPNKVTVTLRPEVATISPLSQCHFLFPSDEADYAGIAALQHSGECQHKVPPTSPSRTYACWLSSRLPLSYLLRRKPEQARRPLTPKICVYHSRPYRVCRQRCIDVVCVLVHHE